MTAGNIITNELNGLTVYRYIIDDFLLKGKYPSGPMGVIIVDAADYIGNGILGYDFSITT